MCVCVCVCVNGVRVWYVWRGAVVPRPWLAASSCVRACARARESTNEWLHAVIDDDGVRYVKKILQQMEGLWIRLDALSTDMPPMVAEAMWSHCYQQVLLETMEGFAAVRKCNPAGRGMMKMDLTAIVRGIEKIHPVDTSLARSGNTLGGALLGFERTRSRVRARVCMRAYVRVSRRIHVRLRVFRLCAFVCALCVCALCALCVCRCRCLRARSPDTQNINHVYLAPAAGAGRGLLCGVCDGTGDNNQSDARVVTCTPESIDAYLKAFYFDSRSDLMEWVRDNKDRYYERWTVGLALVGVGAKMKMHEKEKLRKEIAALYAQ